MSDVKLNIEIRYLGLINMEDTIGRNRNSHKLWANTVGCGTAPFIKLMVEMGNQQMTEEVGI